VRPISSYGASFSQFDPGPVGTTLETAVGDLETRMISAALNRDYGLVLGTTILYMFIVLAVNLIVDILYAWLDPKVRYS